MSDNNQCEEIDAKGPKIYYEDLVVGSSQDAGSYYVDKDEVISFALEWDPQPFHVDEVAAKQSIFGCLTGSSIHMKAVLSRIVSSNTGNLAALANLSTRYDMPNPMRVGDTLHFSSSVTEKRLSSSRPGVGIVSYKTIATNQDGEVIMDHDSVVMIQCQPTDH